MSKTKLLIGAVILLLLMNIALMAALIIGKPGGPIHRPNQGPRQMIVKRLNFDKQQARAFELLMGEHKEQMQEKEGEMRDLKDALYSQLKTDTGIKDSLLQKLGQLQTEIETIHFEHFSEVKSLCREDQLPAFAALTENLGQLLGRRPPAQRRKRN